MKHKRPPLLKRAVFDGYDYGLLLTYIEGSNRLLLDRQGYFIRRTEHPQHRAWRIPKARVHEDPEALFRQLIELAPIKTQRNPEQLPRQTLSALSEKLSQEEQSARSQLSNSFSALKKRLESCGETLIDSFASKVRNSIYTRIEEDISNDAFKSALTEEFETQQRQLSKQLPVAVNAEVRKFQKAAEDIVTRFEKHAQELTANYGKLGSMRFNQPFNLNIKIDNGVKVAGLLASLVGIAAAPFTGGASLWFVGASVLTALVSIGKALWSALSTDSKMSQQRQALDKNLRSATQQLRDMLRESLNIALNEMQGTIDQLDLALEAPAKQAANQVNTLSRSTIRLKTLSRQIEIAGNL